MDGGRAHAALRAHHQRSLAGESRELRLTVVNLEAFLPTLGLDQMLSQEQASPQVNSAFGALDRIMPGLGNVARKNAAPMIAATDLREGGFVILAMTSN